MTAAREERIRKGGPHGDPIAPIDFKLIQAAADEAERETHGPPLHEDVLVQLFRQCTDLEVDYPDVWDRWSFARIKWVHLNRYHRERDRVWRESVATRVATIEDEDGASWKAWVKDHVGEE